MMEKRPLRTTRRLTNLAQGRASWYRVTNQASGPTKVSIYDEIGFMAVSAQEFVSDLEGIAGDIELHINSPGGDVFDGIAIYNALKQREGAVAVVVDGLAASAASFVAQAASPGQLSMSPHSQLMIHDGFGLAIGNAADMRTMADLLDKASDNIAGIYADRTGKAATYWRDQMRNETWYSDTEAVAAGLADNVLGQESPENSWDMSVFSHWPGQHVTNAASGPAQDGDGETAPEGGQLEGLFERGLALNSGVPAADDSTSDELAGQFRLALQEACAHD